MESVSTRTLQSRAELCNTQSDQSTGFQISRAFALEGCRVIMINRKEDQGQASIDEIRKEKPDAKIEWEGCDLGTLKEVKQVFTGLRERLDRCDLVSETA